MTAAPPTPDTAASEWLDLDIRPMRQDEAVYAAALHEACLPHGFFGRLGQRFLVAYYTTFVDSPYAVALVVALGGSPAGVLVGTLRNGVHYRWVVRRRGLRLAALGILGVLTHPTAARMALRRIRRYVPLLRRLLGRRPAVTRRRRGPVLGVLTHVAVAPGARRSGAGAALCNRFLATAAERGVEEVRLVTEAGPRGAGSFYAANGWTPAGTRHDWDGDLVEAWRRPLDDLRPPGRPGVATPVRRRGRRGRAWGRGARR